MTHHFAGRSAVHWCGPGWRMGGKCTQHLALRHTDTNARCPEEERLEVFRMNRNNARRFRPRKVFRDTEHTHTEHATTTRDSLLTNRKTNANSWEGMGSNQVNTRGPSQTQCNAISQTRNERVVSRQSGRSDSLLWGLLLLLRPLVFWAHTHSPTLFLVEFGGALKIAHHHMGV